MIYDLYRFFIYEHERIGYHGRYFKMLKIRTMVLGSDSMLEDVVKKHGRDARGKIINDPRFTCIGRFLKKYRIDELPQLFNILKGDMAVIGPRPHSFDFSKEYVPEDLKETRLQVKPGWLKPQMAFCDYDYGTLEWEAERRFLDDVDKKPGCWLRYAIRALAPGKLKWQLHPGGRVFRKHEFYVSR